MNINKIDDIISRVSSEVINLKIILLNIWVNDVFDLLGI